MRCQRRTGSRQMIFHIWPRALRFIYFVYKIRGTKRAPRGTYTESCFPVSVSLSHVGIKQNIAMLCGTNYDMYKLVKKGLPFKEFAVICFDGRCRNPSVQEGAEGEESSSSRQVKRGCICFLVSTRCFCSFVPKHLGLPKSTWRNSRKGDKKSQYMLVSIGCSPGTLRLPNALLRPTCTPNC